MLFKQFEYSIPSRVNTIAGRKQNHIVAEHLPLMNALIDFENGNLKLQVDCDLMMASNKDNEPGRSGRYKGRVQVETAIHASSVINLDDPGNDGLIFLLEGTIKDDNHLGSCSGLLMFDNLPLLKGLNSDTWTISLYLYDLQLDNCEITFKLPVFTTSADGNKNGN